jgi:ribokinase
VLVTLGAAGALVVPRDGEAFEVRAPSVEAVDAVGAGDAYNGAFAAALARGLPLPEAAWQAVAAGSLATRRPGAREGMPTRDELDALLGGGPTGAPS